MGVVDVFLSPHLYNNKKLFLKSINKTGEGAIDSNALIYMRRQLRDPTYTISKICGFWAGKGFHTLDVNFKDFVLPDFKIELKLKNQSLPDSLNFFMKFPLP